MAAAVITIVGTDIAVATGLRQVSVPINIAVPLDASTVINLASGFNTITPPPGCTAICLIPPAGNTVTLTLKGITGDTGVALDLVNPTWISSPAGAAIGITTNGVLNGFQVLYF